jgi:hypothetical protein
VQLHRDLAKDGLVVITLDVDTTEIEKKGEVLKFLTGQKADCANYIFTGDEDAVYDWMVKYDATATPALVVFNRQGERVVVPEVEAEGTPAEKKAAHLKAEREFVQKLLAEK